MHLRKINPTICLTTGPSNLKHLVANAGNPVNLNTSRKTKIGLNRTAGSAEEPFNFQHRIGGLKPTAC